MENDDKYIELDNMENDDKYIELDNIMSELQGSLFVEKQNVGVFKDMRYWNYEDIVVKLKPLLKKYGVRFVWKFSRIVSIPFVAKSFISDPRSGGGRSEDIKTTYDNETKRTHTNTKITEGSTTGSGSKSLESNERLFLEMGLCVRYQGIESDIQTGVTDISSSISKDSSQAIGSHESYLKKRILGNFLMIATDEAKSDADNNSGK